MLEFFIWLKGIDQSLFFFFNQTLANPVTDIFMPFITNDNHLRIFYAVCLLIILWKGDNRLRLTALFSLLTVAICDQAVSTILKPLLARPRPCHELEVHLLVGCGAGMSMPSSHAANLFGQAFFFKKVAPFTAKYLIPLAILVALSRVFVGVHYPADILVGAAIGTLVGMGVSALFLYLLPKMMVKLKIEQDEIIDENQN